MQAEIAALKEQIKAEVLQEMRQTNCKYEHWNEVKDSFEPRLKKLILNTYHYYQSVNAIGTIVRHALGLQSVVRMKKEQVEKAKAVTAGILDAMEANRHTG